MCSKDPAFQTVCLHCLGIMYCVSVGMYHSETNGAEWTKQQNEWSRSSPHRSIAHYVLDWCYHKVLGLCQSCHHLVIWSFQFIVPSFMVLKDWFCSQVLIYSVDPVSSTYCSHSLVPVLVDTADCGSINWVRIHCSHFHMYSFYKNSTFQFFSTFYMIH